MNDCIPAKEWWVPCDARVGRACEVFSGLWIGGATSSQDREFLGQNRVRTVVSVGVPPPENQLGDVVYQHIAGVYDSPDQHLPACLFDAAAEFVQRSLLRGGVLVHCQAGISRSPSFVVAYLMKAHGRTMVAALRDVRRARPFVAPNRGFLEDLRAYEIHLNSVRTKASHTDNDEGWNSSPDSSPSSEESIPMEEDSPRPLSCPMEHFQPQMRLRRECKPVVLVRLPSAPPWRQGKA